MSTVEPSRRRWETLLWLLPVVLLALPNCGLQSGGCVPGSSDCPIVDECGPNDSECNTDPCDENPNDPECNVDPCEEDPNGPGCSPCELDPSECPDPDPVEEFEPGTDPSDAIFCDIPKPLEEGVDVLCATQAEADDLENISLAEAATALVDGDSKSFALDFSDDAKALCGGLPKKIMYFDGFPDGTRVCINCGQQIPSKYATLTKACIAKCTDLVNVEGPIPAEGAAAYCEANAKLSTNHQDTCYPDACTIGGTPNMSWVDPRKSPEPVIWTDHIGTDDGGGTNNLERTAATTGGTTADFNAGAASAQVIGNGGDGWVEFEAEDGTDKVHVLGLRSSCAVPANCADTDPHIETVGFAIDLNSDGQVYVLEPDDAIPGSFLVYGPFGSYTVGERYRIRVTDNLDANFTGSISYHRVFGGVEQPAFATNTAADPQYPLRVDTTFREQGARISNVNIVRIK